MKYAKKLWEILLCLCLAVFLLAALPSAGEEALYDGIIRLHVVAEDDSRVSQDRKLAVRDAVLREYGETLKAQNAQEAKEDLAAMLPRIRETVERVLAEEGAESSAEVTLKTEYFETRKYGEITLPAGYYTSLCVTIGRGEGQNWWCVLYPALCTEAALGGRVSAEDMALSPEEYRLVTGTGYVVRFRALEILSTLLAPNERTAAFVLQ